VVSMQAGGLGGIALMLPEMSAELAASCSSACAARGCIRSSSCSSSAPAVRHVEREHTLEPEDELL